MYECYHPRNNNDKKYRGLTNHYDGLLACCYQMPVIESLVNFYKKMQTPQSLAQVYESDY